ncbi:unnamed protein product [Ectocarpus sp. 6 AP-2014]
MPSQVPPLLPQLLRPQQYSRHRSPRPFQRAAPATACPPAAADLATAAAGTTTGANMTATASPRQQQPRPFKSAAAAVQLYKQCYRTPSVLPPSLSNSQTPKPCGCSDVLSHHLIYHTRKHTLWVFGRAVTPPGLSQASSSCTLYRPGYIRCHTPHRIPHPVKMFMNPKFYHRGVFSCVVYGTVLASPLRAGYIPCVASATTTTEVATDNR